VAGIAGVLAWLSAAIPVVAQTQPAELNKRIDLWTADLKGTPSPNADVLKSLAELRKAINELEGKGPARPDDVVNFHARSDELSPIAQRIVTGQASAILAVTTKAIEILKVLQAIEAKDPTQAAINRAGSLSTAVVLPGLVKTYPGLQTSITELLPKLEAIEALNLLDALARRADVLTTNLADATAVGLPMTPKAVEEVTALQVAIQAYRRSAQPMVDILHAEYGDLYAGRRGDHRRTCDATLAVRKQCQGKPLCSLPANPETTLCGYDPVPHAAARDKGASILFRCLDALLKVYVTPVTGTMKPDRGNATWVLVRGTGEEFTCAPSKPTDEAGTEKK
jgi:hypothetical protein